MSSLPFQSGGFTGAILDAWPVAQVASRLASPADWLRNAVRAPTTGPHPLLRHALRIDDADVPVAIKTFRPARLASLDRRGLGSRARRSFITGTRLHGHGVGTPRPIAFLERWEGERLAESHYLCVYEQAGTSLREELDRLYREGPLARHLMALLQAVASEVARMHAAGVLHLDLGNQNILVTRDGPDAWTDVRFIDLDRARVFERLDLRQRARDLSRIALPSDFLRIFRHMYFGLDTPPPEFLRWEAFYRGRYALHGATRSARHPVRTWRATRRAPSRAPAAPRGRDLWVWDDLSVQAIATEERRTRYRHYPWKNAFYIGRGLLRSTLPVLRRHRELLEGSFTREVALAGRIGMAVGTEAGLDPREWPLLEALGPLPVQVRLYRHAGAESNAQTLADARRLRAAGHSVYLALVQDRWSLVEPARWQAFVQEWLPRFAGVADQVEIGHSVNRVKWGIWDLREYRDMVAAVARVARASGPFRLTGPAAIDFEYHFLAGFLDVLPRDGGLDALSHHLYVDRRGAPENRQGGYAALEKFALAKAFAAHSGAIAGDRLIVSEVNWPVRGTGRHSPVCAPYVPAGSGAAGRGSDEESCADFVVRYYALALCSGLVDSVYWWRLAAHGFGLVDDLARPWRPRPAYAALRHFARLLGTATFVERLATPPGSWALRFRLGDGRGAVMAWAHPAPVRLQPPFAFATLLARDGAELAAPATGVTLDASPVYFLDVR